MVQPTKNALNTPQTIQTLGETPNPPSLGGFGFYNPKLS